MGNLSNPTRLLIDIGSSTTKIYSLDCNKNLELIKTRSISFKDGFDPKHGISEPNKKELFDLFLQLKKDYTNIPIKIYATAVFRKLEPATRLLLIDEFFEETKLYLNVISHELESFYLETALTELFQHNEPILLINIGGGSTELVVMQNHQPIERHNLDLGIATVLKKFPDINNQFSSITLYDTVMFVQDQLPDLENTPQIAFYNGGELTYMRLCEYPTQSNNIFQDPDHPILISTKDFAFHNQKIFNQISLDNLKQLMPADPNWMNGARACSAIAQAICQKYEISKIVPSDSNLIDGVARQEFHYVTLSGSFRKHLDYIVQIKKQLEDQGAEIISPRFTSPTNPGEEFVTFQGEEDQTPLQLERHHLEAIEKSDALVVCDPNGYVGASAMMEIGYAHFMAKRIIFTEPPEDFMLNTMPAEVGL